MVTCSLQLPDELDVLPDGRTRRIITGLLGDADQSLIQIKAESSSLDQGRRLLDVEDKISQLRWRADAAKVRGRTGQAGKGDVLDHLLDQMAGVELASNDVAGGRSGRHGFEIGQA